MGVALAMKGLVQDIASSHDNRAKRVREIRGETKQVMGEAQGLIKAFQVSRKQAGAQLRRDLARDKAHRKSEVIGILREAEALLRGFDASRKKTGVQLRKDLSRATANRRSEVTKTLEEAQKLIKDFQSDHWEMGRELRKGLAESRSDIKSDVGVMLKNFHRAQEEVRADLRQAAAAWQGLAKTIQAKRAEVKLPPRGKKEAVRKGMTDLEVKLLAAVSEHPSGISLTEVAESLSVATVVLGRAARSLLEKGKIRKKDGLYFP